MIEIIKRNPVAVAIALAMHLVIVLFMLVGVDWLEKPQQPKSRVEVVQARVVDQALVAAEVEKLKQAEVQETMKLDDTKRKEEQQLAELIKKQQAEKKRITDLENKRKQLQDEVKKRETESLKAKEKATKIAAEKRKAKKKAEKIAAEKRKAKKKAEKIAAEKRKAKKKAEKIAAQKRKAKKLAAEKRRAKERAEKAAAEKALQVQMRQEQFAREGVSVRAAILDKVIDKWVVVVGSMSGAVDRGLKCTVRVRLGGNGSVLLAQVVKSSGDTVFDSSVEKAVRNSGPLPMPSVPELRNHPAFREHTFVFDPSLSR